MMADYFDSALLATYLKNARLFIMFGIIVMRYGALFYHILCPFITSDTILTDCT